MSEILHNTKSCALGCGACRLRCAPLPNALRAACGEQALWETDVVCIARHDCYRAHPWDPNLGTCGNCHLGAWGRVCGWWVWWSWEAAAWGATHAFARGCDRSYGEWDRRIGGLPTGCCAARVRSIDPPTPLAEGGTIYPSTGLCAGCLAYACRPTFTPAPWTFSTVFGFAEVLGCTEAGDCHPVPIGRAVTGDSAHASSVEIMDFRS